jgi:hypothetical protein
LQRRKYLVSLWRLLPLVWSILTAWVECVRCSFLLCDIRPNKNMKYQHF